MNFQRQLAITPTSLHTIAVVVMVLWLIVGIFGNTPNPFDFGHHTIVASGWWTALPAFMRTVPWVNSLMGMLTAVVTCYAIAELNTSQVLLRVNSRVMTIVFGALITACPFLHTFNPGMISMLCVLLSYFALFSSYQLENSASHAYVAFLYFSLATLMLPKLLWLAPIYWLSMYILRSVNPRSVCASVLGLLTPYWIVGAFAYCFGKMPEMLQTLSQFYTFRWGDYSHLTPAVWVTVCLAFVMFVIGVLDFFARIYMDKNRTRNLYYVIILHGFAYFLLLILQPINVQVFMPLALVSTSIMAGHYVANGATSASNILTIIISVAIIISLILNAWIL